MDHPNPDYRKLRRQLFGAFYYLITVMLLVAAGALYYALAGDPFEGNQTDNAAQQAAPSIAAAGQVDGKVENGIHLDSGLKVADGFEVARATCTACHSGKLVAQNRATREGWEQMIRWMQKTQGLWDLGPNEPVILDYLAQNYGPEQLGRRPNLEAVEWYILDPENTTADKSR